MNYCEDCGRVVKLAPSDVVLVQRDLMVMRASIINLKTKGGMQSPAITREIVSAASGIDVALKHLKNVQGLLK